MKSIAAILLMGLLFFNWVGYQLYTAVRQAHADENMVAKIDLNNYSDNDLISIKVPAVHLSYYVNSKEFQRVDGQIEIGGLQYNYVKRRFQNDSVELLCIPNKTATGLQKANDEFFKLVNDIQHPGQSKKSEQNNSFFKGFNAEYYSDALALAIPDPSLIKREPADRYQLRIPSVYLSPSCQPPDFL